LKSFAEWVSDWKSSSISNCEKFTLTSQTSSALVYTLKCSVSLSEDLINEGYDFVLMARLQSDPIERRFSLYRQMSGGRFLVGLRVLNSEKIILMKSLLKENICFWKEDVSVDEENNFDAIKEYLNERENEIEGAELSRESEEVAVYISGYVAKKLRKRLSCTDCNNIMKSVNSTDIEDGYLKILNRGGLLVPCNAIINFCSKSFAILDSVQDLLLLYASNNIRESAENILNRYSPSTTFACQSHKLTARKWACRTISNIFLNNEQKISTSSIRKDDIKSFKKQQIEKRK